MSITRIKLILTPVGYAAQREIGYKAHAGTSELHINVKGDHQSYSEAIIAGHGDLIWSLVFKSSTSN